MDVEGGKGSTNRLWMRYGRLYGDPDKTHTRSCQPTSIEKIIQTQLSRQMRFLIRSCGYIPREAYELILEQVTSVCETERADASIVLQIFRSFDQMKKELAKEAKKYQLYGPRIHNKHDEASATATDLREPNRSTGNRHRPPLRPRPVYGRSKSGVPCFTLADTCDDDGGTDMVLSEEQVDAINVDEVIEMVDGEYYHVQATTAADEHAALAAFNDAKVSLFTTLDQLVDVYASAEQMDRLTHHLQQQCNSVEAFAAFIDQLADGTRRLTEQRRPPHVAKTDSAEQTAGDVCDVVD